MPSAAGPAVQGTGPRGPSRPCRPPDRSGTAAALAAYAARTAGRRRGRPAGRGVTSSSSRARAADRRARDPAAGHDLAAERGQLRSSASTSRALPPSTTGQPTAWASIVEQQAEGAGERRGERPHGVRGSARQQRLALVGPEPPRQQLAGSRPLRPNRAIASGCRGTERSGASMAGTISAGVADQRPEAAAGRPPRRRRAAARSRRPSRDRGGPPAVERVSEGHLRRNRSVTPSAARSAWRKNGEAAASGWTAEQTS